MKIKKFEEFTKKGDHPMLENENVATLDMKKEAQQHIQDANENLSMAADSIYAIKKMADYVKFDFPELSEKLEMHTEEVLIEIEKIQEKVKKIVNHIK